MSENIEAKLSIQYSRYEAIKINVLKMDSDKLYNNPFKGINLLVNYNDTPKAYGSFWKQQIF